MKIFKIILILILLFSLSFGVCGDTSLRDSSSTTDMTTETNKTYVSWVDDESDTLLEWFKNLTLDEKVEIYMWWKYESVNLVIVNDKWSGEITIRVNKEE